MKRNLSSSALNLQAMTVAMAATELKIPFHLSIPQSFRAKDHGAGAEGISFLYFFSTPCRVEVYVPFFKLFKDLPSHCAMNGGGGWRVDEHRGCSAAIHLIEVRDIFLISSECSSFLLATFISILGHPEGS